MEDFYFYSSIIALVILIGILTMIGITISKGNKTKVYPPVQNECPDYWEQGTQNSLIKGNTRANTLPSDYCKYSKSTNKGNVAFSSKMDPKSNEWNSIKNKIGGNTMIDGAAIQQYYIQFRNNDASWNSLYPGVSVRCAKRKWARDNGIVWDGVSNFNGCVPK